MLSSMALALNPNINEEQFSKIVRDSTDRKIRFLEDLTERLEGKSIEEKNEMVLSVMPVLIHALMF